LKSDLITNCKQGQHLGVNLISFRQAPGGSGKISDLTRINHDHWQPGSGQGRSDRPLVAAGRFQNNPLGSDLSEMPSKPADALWCILDAFGLEFFFEA
jgi:hypothetical protein